MHKSFGNQLAIAFVGGLVGFAAVPALAGSGDAAKDPARIEEMFKKFDQDASGGISFDEFTAHRGERFKKHDTNSDGQVTLEEFTADASANKLERRKERFAKMDANGDGVLTLEDGETRSRDYFAKIDSSGDGNVTLAEFTAAAEAHHKKDETTTQ
jgi:Ca2+-binding EF-hand superfamily protein